MISSKNCRTGQLVFYTFNKSFNNFHYPHYKMWCCSRGAKVLFNSVMGGPETPASNDDDDSDSESSRDHIVTSSNKNTSSLNSKTTANSVVLDLGYVGREVVIVKNGLRICGNGGGLGSAPLVQTKSYFEIKFQQEGLWGIGVATRQCQLDTGPLGKDTESWVLRNTGELFHNNMSIGKLQQTLQEGDIIVRNKSKICCILSCNSCLLVCSLFS